jgi:hypothetical protein
VILNDGSTVVIYSQVVDDGAILDKVKVVASRSLVRKESDWIESVRLCIIQRESRGNYRAQNRHSSASGAYQFLDGTWHAVTGLGGSAKDYSVSIQDAAFYKLFDSGRGRSNWSYPPQQCW